MNLLVEDRPTKVVIEEILLGSYPMVAKQLARQLLIVLQEWERANSRAAPKRRRRRNRRSQ